MRRRLRKAAGGRDSSRTWQKLEQDFARLQHNEQQRDLAVNVAEALMWHGIAQRDSSVLSAEWFAILPEAAENTWKLGWDLAVLAADSGDYGLFKRYAFGYIRTGIPSQWSDLCYFAAHAYACGERADCKSILKSSSNNSLQKLDRRTRAAAIALCSLPVTAPSLKSLLKQAKPIVPAVLGFSPEMHADAYLLEARIADWQDDRQEMDAKITAAEKIGSNSPQVAYWRQRFDFRQTEFGRRYPIERTVDNAAWRRLEKMADAVADPTLENATIVQGILTRQYQEIEFPEQRLILRVLRPMLTAGFDHSTADIKRMDLLCAELDALSDSPIDWSYQTHLVAALVEGNLEAAGKIADGSRLPGNQASRELQKTVNLLRGRCDGPRLFEPAVFADIGPRIVECVPCLSELKAMIDLVPKLAAGGLDEIPAVLGRQLPPTAPSWIRWLQTRLLFLAEPSAFLSRATSLDVSDVVVAWEVDRIVREVLPIGAGANAQVIQARKSLENCDVREYTKSWRGRLDQLISLEIDIDREFRAAAAQHAVQNLRLGAMRDSSVLKAHRKLLEKLKKRVLSSPFTAAFWVPVLEYWQAVAGLSAADRENSPGVSTDSWMWPRVVGQMALFEIARGELDAADRWLGQTEADHAGVLYARALCAARRGDNTNACKFVDELIEKATDCPTYAQAAKRLKAALLEREGDVTGALDIYLGLLRQEPEDAVARTRSLRILLQKSYGLEVDDDSVNLLELVDKQISDNAMFGRLQKIVCLMQSDSDVALDGEPNGLRLLKGRRLLANGDLAAAAQVIEPTEAIASKLILQAAELLRDLGSGVHDDARLTDFGRRLGECEHSLEELNDDTLRAQIERWRGYIQTAIRVLNAECAEDCGEQEILSGLQSDRWSKAQRSLAALLSLPTEVLHEDYMVLLPELDALPVDGADVWLAFARHWLKESNFTELLESELPDCIAELDDPRVRWIIALGYTKASVEAYRKQNSRQAISWASRARTTLEELVGVESRLADPVTAHEGEADVAG